MGDAAKRRDAERRACEEIWVEQRASLTRRVASVEAELRQARSVVVGAEERSVGQAAALVAANKEARMWRDSATAKERALQALRLQAETGAAAAQGDAISAATPDAAAEAGLMTPPRAQPQSQPAAASLAPGAAVAPSPQLTPEQDMAEHAAELQLRSPMRGVADLRARMGIEPLRARPRGLPLGPPPAAAVAVGAQVPQASTLAALAVQAPPASPKLPVTPMRETAAQAQQAVPPPPAAALAAAAAARAAADAYVAGGLSPGYRR